MFVRFLLFVFAMALMGPLAATSVQAQEIGQIASASGSGEVRTSGGRAALKTGLRLSVGDVVTTSAEGKAQLLFDDGTKIVVGPGSRLVIDQILMQSNGKAERFAVSAVGGTFRFITGNSAKKAYEITTPTATMGIRGTLFDFAVREKEATNLVLFKGQVRMCGKNKMCAEVRGRCTVVGVEGRGEISNFSGKENLEAKDNVIVADFPFVLDQAPLKREFRAPVQSCGDVESRVAIRQAKKLGLPAPAAPAPTGGSGNREQASVDAPEPEAPEPPEPPGPPDPEPAPGG